VFRAIEGSGDIVNHAVRALRQSLHFATLRSGQCRRLASLAAALRISHTIIVRDTQSCKLTVSAFAFRQSPRFARGSAGFAALIPHAVFYIKIILYFICIDLIHLKIFLAMNIDLFVI